MRTKKMDEKNYNAILEYLETSYSGAKMLDDIECMCRLSRAIAAFEADPEEEIFTEDFKERYYSR